TAKRRPGLWSGPRNTSRRLKREISSDLAQRAVEALLDRLGGLGRHLLRVLGKLLGLRREGIKLFSPKGAVELDPLRIRFGIHELAHQIESRVAVGARGLDQLEAVARAALVGR